MPSLDRLRVLEALLRLRSPSLASVELGVTQSAVSKTLAVLRAEFKDPILMRRGNTMMPTALGERLLGPLNAALNDLERAVKKNEFERPRALAIAMRDQFVLTLGPGLARDFCRSEPRGKIDFLPYDRASVGRSLEQGDFHMAVAVDPPISPGLMTRELYKDTFVCLTPHKGRPTLKQYLQLPHVVTVAHSGYAGIDSVLAPRKLTRTIVASVPYFMAAIHLAKEERLTLTLPSRVAQEARIKGLYTHPLPIEVPGFSAILLWDERFHKHEENVWLRQLVIGVAARL